MKEKVTKFNLEDAFKALNEIEIPKVKGVKPNRTNHKELVESMRPTPKTDCLLEDYYDVNNQEDLGVAQADRAEEVAQAKLAKIEKIVDLDAETPDDIQPSYVGKTIIQCPQCMTLFYKNPEDINVSEEDPTVVNIGEQCPNCNNDSGYTVIGKVAAEEPAIEETPVKEGELDLNFEEPVEEAPAEEIPAEENSEEEINLEPVEEPVEEVKEPKEEEKSEEEEEKKEESFEPHSENILAEQVENALTEATNADELSKKLKEHDEYIKVLQDEIKAEEEAIKNAKNDFIKKMHEKNLESLKDALDKAIPEEVKAEAAIEELPTAEDAAEDMTKNEALNEEKCPICGDELNGKEPCEKCQKEIDKSNDADDALKDNDSLKEADMHLMTRKEFEAAAEEAGIEKPVHEEICEDVIAKDAPEENENVELNQANVSEIHKGKTEHVPGAIVEESLNEADVPEAEIEKMLDSKEFQTPISEAEVEALLDSKHVDESCTKKFFEAIEEIRDVDIEKCITESLINVYENVDSFKLVSCELHENKLIISGNINFKSGNSKSTTYIFTEAAINNREFKLTGLNESLDKNGAFILNGLTEDSGTTLIVKELSYKYHIGDTLIEGIVR